MVQVKNNLKICSLLNLILVLILLFLDSNMFFMHTIFLASTSYYYYVCSKMSDNELSYNKTFLIILSIISLGFNFITSIILLSSLNRIESIKKVEENKTDKLLKFSSFLIIASTFILTISSWNLNEIFKVIFLLVDAICFIFLSKFTEKNNNIKNSSVIYFIISMIFFILSYLVIGKFYVFGSYFSFTGEGRYLYMTILYILLSAIMYVLYKKYNKNICLYLSVLFLVISSINILNYIGLNISDSILIHNILFLIFTLIYELSNKKNENINNISNLIVIFLSFMTITYLESFSLIILLLINLIINIINIFYVLFNNKKNAFIYSLLIDILIIKNILYLNVSDYKMPLLLLLLFIVNIMYLFVKDLKEFSKINNIIFNITALFIGFSYNEYNPYLLILMGMIIFIQNIISIKKDEINKKIEYNLFPFKAVFLYITIINLLKSSILGFSYYLLILAFIFILINNLNINNFLRKQSYIISIVLIILGTLYFDFNIINFILYSICYIILINNSKDKIKISLYIIFNLFLYLNIVSNNIFNINSNISYLIIILIYILMLILGNKNKYNYLVTAIFILLPLNGFTSNIIEYSAFNIVIIRLYYLYLIYILLNKFINNNKNIISSILVSLVLLFTVIYYEDLVISIFIILASVILILIGYYYDDYKYLFKLGFIWITITILFNFMFLLEAIPFSLYVFIIGITITFMIIYKESKK